MPYKEWSNILEKISHDRSLSGANVIEKIKKELQSYPAVYKEWENADQNTFKATLLCFAAEGGHIDVVKALLNAEGIDVRATNKAGWTALHYAVKEGHIDIAELLLKNGADIDAKTNRDAWTTLSLIIFLNDEKCNLLNDEKCEEKVKFLLKKGANVNAVELFGRTPLHLAIEKGNLNVVKALLEAKGIDVNAAGTYGETLLHHASLHGNKDIVELLLAKRADPNLRNDDKNVPLHYASSEGHINVVEALLANGADVDAVDGFKQTPLHHASEKGSLEMVKHLLANDASVNAVDFFGQTPLHHASKKGSLEVVEHLLENGTNANAVDQYGRTPLHYASGKGSLEVVKRLLANGADVDVVDKYGKTPLHRAALHRAAHKGHAAHEGHIKVVKALLDKGANPIKVLNSYFYKAKLVNKDITQHLKEITQHLKEAKEKINRSASNLFWAVFTNKEEEAEKIIEFSKQEGRLATMLERGLWIKCLFISEGKAKELAKKDNKEIIKEIQTRQAIVIGLAGGVMAVFAIVAIAAIILTASTPMTVGATLGIVAAGALGFAGLLGIGFACCHVPKKPPSAEMNEVGNKQHAPVPSPNTPPGVSNT